MKKIDSVMYTIEKIIKISFIFLAIAIGIFILIFGYFVFDIGDYFIYKHSVSTKEDVITKFNDNKEEFDIFAKFLIEKLINQNEETLNFYGKKEFKTNEINNNLLKEFPIFFIGISAKENETYDIQFLFAFCPTGYNYWGLVYADNGEPPKWGVGELKEKDGVYTEIGSYYKYETEKITDNWYYFQCWTK